MDSRVKSTEDRLAIGNGFNTSSGGEPSVLPQNVYLIRPPEGCESRKVHRFNYEPLATPTAIRLLKLHPLGTWDSEIDIYRPIHCSLIHMDLDEFPDYDALSYTWGDPLGSICAQREDAPSADVWSAPAFDIYCNNQQISVTTNLYTALLALRCRNMAKGLEGSFSVPSTHQTSKDTRIENNDSQCAEYMWIDQICINQTDFPERNRQVQMMTRLYRQAKKVHVWLGGDDEFARAAQNIELCLSALDLTKAEDYRSFRILNRNTYELLGIPYISVQRWIALYTFFNRTWFQRAWIVQEVAVARMVNFSCGLFVWSFPALGIFLEFLKQSGWLDQIMHIVQEFHVKLGQRSRSDRNFIAVSKLSNRFNKYFLIQIADIRYTMDIDGVVHPPTEFEVQRYPLLDLLKTFRNAQATNPLDKIYAFIGLSKEFADGIFTKRNAELVPNYRKSPRDVYIEAAKFIMSFSGNLEYLSLKEDESLTNIKSLPSWVPDFSVATNHYELNFGFHQWSASYSLGTAHIHYMQKDALEVRGVKVGEVGLLHSLCRGFAINSEKERLKHIDEVLDTGEGLIQFLQALPEACCVGKPENGRSMQQAEEDAVSTMQQSRFEAFWRTVLTDCFEGHYPAPTYCGEAILADMEYVIYGKMTSAMSYSSQKRFLSETGIIDWKLLRDQVGQEYTDWKRLQGHYPYDREELLYPPGFRIAMEKLGLNWNYGYGVENPSKIAKICGLVLQRAIELANASPRRVAVRNKALAACAGKTLFITTHGQIGTALLSARIGDEVWVLAGASIPFVLRPSRNGRYRLLGQAYLHGIMHGEFTRNPSLEKGTDIVLI